MIKTQVLQACRFLLGPIVRILLRSGIPWSDFADLSKEVYVEVARRDYGIQGRPTNLARVAMMTGLSRREVGRLRKLMDDGSGEALIGEDRLSRILTGWHLDAKFQDRAGSPMVLAADGEGPSILSLFRKYAGDMPHGALLKEMLQLGLVEATDSGAFRVLVRDYVRTAQDPAIIRQMGIALHDHGTTLAHNISQDRTTPARFEGMATNAKVGRRFSQNFERLIEQRGEKFLEEVDAWLSQHEIEDDQEPENEHARMGVGIYLIYDDKK